jgi:lambda repressor-like predicted transcriptional regulator
MAACQSDYLGGVTMPRRGKKTKGEASKAELIRQTAKSLGKTFRPRDIIAKLKERGVVVSYNQVSKALKASGFRRRGRRKAAAANGTGETSKAQRIRNVAKALGKKVRPRDVIAELAKEGVTVSSAQVSATLRKAGYRRRRRGRVASAVATATSGNGLSLDALLAAKDLIERVGGVEAAEEALKAMKKLA